MRSALLIFCLTVYCSPLLAGEPEDMVRIPSGSFWMGSDEGLASERPAHQVTLDPYWIDKYPITNQQYLNFVQHTGYVTYSEKDPDPKEFPDVPKEKLVAGDKYIPSAI